MQALNKSSLREFLRGPVVDSVLPMQEAQVHPWSGNDIPHATTKSLQTMTKTQCGQINFKFKKN